MEVLTQRERWEGRRAAKPGEKWAHVQSGLFDKYLRKSVGKVCLEIGCVPGGSLAYLCKQFLYTGEGIDYVADAPEIVAQTMRNFGLGDCKVYVHDILTWMPEKEYDLVFSGGFIEHFRDATLEKVIEKHISILKKQGIVIIAVPNFNNAQYLIHWLLDRKNLKQHNVKTMTVRFFQKVARKHGLKTLFLGYDGGAFDYWIENRNLNRAQKMIQWVLDRVKWRLDASPLRDRCNRFLSPRLVFIGKRID